MRRNLTLALIAAVGYVISVTAAEEPWFDFEKCMFCKAFASQPGLIDHMKTEYHDTKTGIISVTYIDKDYEAAFKRAQDSIGQVVADKVAGKQIVACKHCAAIGDFYAMGLTQESIKSEKCIIVIYSSSDPAVVTKLQDFAKKTNEAFAELAKNKESASAKK
jgi:hypothetical protein